MARLTGVYISNEFLKNEAASLSTAQLGILIKIFDLMNQNTDANKWGLLVNSKGKPISDRKVRYHCGDGTIVSFTTWDKAKKTFYELELLEDVKLQKDVYVYSKPFVKMNPYSGAYRGVYVNEDKERAMEHSKEAFLGYDPADLRPMDKLDTWGKICRLWIENTKNATGCNPPFPVAWNAEARTAAKTRLIAQAEQIGVDQAITDMREAFQGNREIMTLTYFSARWLTKDWKNRAEREAQAKPVKREPLKEEIRVLAKRGILKTKEDVYGRYSNIRRDILDGYIKEVFA